MLRALLLITILSLAAAPALACENAMKREQVKQKERDPVEVQRTETQALQLIGVSAIPLALAGLLVVRRRDEDA